MDFDSTYLFSRSKRRQGVDRTYKKGYALHPLLCFDAMSGAAVHARLRRGKAGASTGMRTFLAETLRRVPDAVRVRARLDSGFLAFPQVRIGRWATVQVAYRVVPPPPSLNALTVIGHAG